MVVGRLNGAFRDGVWDLLPEISVRAEATPSVRQLKKKTTNSINKWDMQFLLREKGVSVLGN